jgi:hypothetical protein
VATASSHATLLPPAALGLRALGALLRARRRRAGRAA